MALRGTARLNTAPCGAKTCSRGGLNPRSQHEVEDYPGARRAHPRAQRGKSILHADTEMRGFYLIVTANKRGFSVQALVNGRQVRTKLGDHPAMDAKQARDLARQTLVGMRGGTNPNQERRKARARGITLREGLDLHLNSRRLADKTRSGYEYHVTYYLKDWLDRLLAEIGSDRQGERTPGRRPGTCTRQEWCT